MELILHIGPHKTGTTSLQYALLEQYGSSQPVDKIWYPLPSEKGPGHNAIAMALRGNDVSQLDDVINSGYKGNVKKLILSAENFVKCEKNLSNYFSTGRIKIDKLIFTQNSLINRIGSIWQERIKSRSIQPLKDIEDIILKLPAYKPDFISRFINSVCPIKSYIIYMSLYDDPKVLFDRASEALEVDITYPKISKKNERLNMIEAEVLRVLNRHLVKYKVPREEHLKIRNLFLHLFNSPDWKSTIPNAQISPSKYVMDEIYKIADLQYKDISSLSKDGIVYEIGSREVLIESPV